MQSGADNSAALSNEPRDRSAILAVDASVWAMREYEAMALIARRLGDNEAAARYNIEAAATRKAILKHLWLKDEAIFLNRRRDNGAWMRSISWSSFVPVAFGMIPQKEAERTIREHLLNPAEMRSTYGFRSLSKSDPAYNNDAIIDPYSAVERGVDQGAGVLEAHALADAEAPPDQPVLTSQHAALCCLRRRRASPRRHAGRAAKRASRSRRRTRGPGRSPCRLRFRRAWRCSRRGSDTWPARA
jgi:hypothetical protein